MSVQSPSAPPIFTNEEDERVLPSKATSSGERGRHYHRPASHDSDSEGSSDGELCIDETSSDTDVENDELKSAVSQPREKEDTPRRRKSTKWATKHHCEQLEDEVILLRSKLRQISSHCVEIEERFTRRCSTMSGEIQALYQMVANYQLLASQATKPNAPATAPPDSGSSPSSSNGPTNGTAPEQRLNPHRAAAVPPNGNNSHEFESQMLPGGGAPTPQGPSTAAQVALQNIADIRSSQFAGDMTNTSSSAGHHNSMASHLGRFSAHMVHESVAGATSLPSLRSMASGLGSRSLRPEGPDHHGGANGSNPLGLSAIRYFRGQQEAQRVPAPQDQNQRPIKYRIPDTPRKQLSKGRRGNLPSKATAHLRAWLFAHRNRPYPTEEQKAELVAVTDLTLVQINNWFSNARRRILKVDEKNRQNKDSESSPDQTTSESDKAPAESPGKDEEPPKKRFKSEPTSPS